MTSDPEQQGTYSTDLQTDLCMSRNTHMLPQKYTLINTVGANNWQPTQTGINQIKLNMFE